MIRILPFLLLLGGCGALVYLPPSEVDPRQGPAARRQAPHAEIHRVYRMARLLGYQEVGSPEVTNLKNGLQAQSVLLQRTLWTLRHAGQSVGGDLRRRAEYLRLPEKERARHMERSDDFIQIWWVEREDTPKPEAKLAAQLVPTDRPHRYHREAAYLGQDQRVAWYAYAPTPEWIQLRQTEKLTGGQDPVAAALRGLVVKDSGGHTAFACFDLIAAWGPLALPAINDAIARRLPQRGSAVRGVGRHDDPKVAAALVAWAASPDAAVAGAARRALIESPRAEARSLYATWVTADAGRKPVVALLRAVQAIQAPVTAEVLARVMASPESVVEYRLAFELTRASAGRPLAKTLTDAAALILRAGQASGGRGVDQTQVDGGVQVLLSAGDPEAAAVVGLTLAMLVSKGDYRAANRAGVTVLQRVPGKAGERLVAHLARTLRGTDLIQVQKVAAAVRGLATP